MKKLQPKSLNKTTINFLENPNILRQDIVKEAGNKGNHYYPFYVAKCITRNNEELLAKYSQWLDDNFPGWEKMDLGVDHAIHLWLQFYFNHDLVDRPLVQFINKWSPELGSQLSENYFSPITRLEYQRKLADTKITTVLATGFPPIASIILANKIILSGVILLDAVLMFSGYANQDKVKQLEKIMIESKITTNAIKNIIEKNQKSEKE